MQQKDESLRSCTHQMVQDISVRTLTNLVSNFEQSDYVLKIDMKGHHERRWIVLNDDVWGSQLRDYVRTESVQKGQKNMTVKKFRTFVNDVIIPEVIKKGDEKSLSKKIQQNGIAESTARFWFHNIWAATSNKAEKIFTTMGTKEKMLLNIVQSLFQGF